MYDTATLASALAKLESGSDWAILALNYELGSLLEPAVGRLHVDHGNKPLARIWCFEQCQVLTSAEFDGWLAQALVAEAGRHSGMGGLTPEMNAAHYAECVDAVQRYIAAGDCYQVNFTFPLAFEWFGSPLGLYAQLRARQPVSYGGMVADGQGGILSLSPELFIEKQAGHLRTRPMKGTAPRSSSPDSLRDSAKDCAENLMIVDLLRNDLGRLARPGSVKVDRLFDIEAYPTVWQMVSEISADIGDAGLGEILHALFPCGSITGAPKIRAMQIIDELEARPRGIYTGAFGWRAPNGDLRLNVAIRTLELSTDGRGRMGIGSGVVADSLAQAEWEECLLKARFVRNTDPGLLLIETLRREAGRYPLLDGHLDRLERSATWLAYPFDRAAAQAKLDALPAQGNWRVRLTLNCDGELALGCHALAATAGPYQARLAATPIDSRHPLRRHKTTDRAIYDAALAELPADGSVFDIIFLNERGEVAEGARSNVFVERDGILLTPPLSSGALPGVLRGQLLASGRAREAVLQPAELAAGFFLGNALRGLLPATLAG